MYVYGIKALWLQQLQQRHGCHGIYASTSKSGSASRLSDGSSTLRPSSTPDDCRTASHRAANRLPMRQAAAVDCNRGRRRWAWSTNLALPSAATNRWATVRTA